MSQADAITAREWILFLVTVIGVTVALTTVWVKLKSQVNGLGGRVKRVETGEVQLDEKVERNRADVSRITDHLSEINGRVNRTEESLSRLDTHVTEMRFEVLSQLGEIKQLIVSKDSDTRQFFSDRITSVRERVARIESDRGIPHTDD